MNSKIFAYNTGLKSRFTEVHFEDFDEKELAQTPWQQLNVSHLCCKKGSSAC